MLLGFSRDGRWPCRRDRRTTHDYRSDGNRGGRRSGCGRTCCRRGCGGSRGGGSGGGTGSGRGRGVSSGRRWWSRRWYRILWSEVRLWLRFGDECVMITRARTPTRSKQKKKNNMSELFLFFSRDQII